MHDHWRAKRHTTFAELGEIKEVEDGTCSPHEQVERAMLLEAIESALRLLGNDQALVIRRRLEGYEFSEIAVELGRAPDAVEALYHRGVASLRLRINPPQEVAPVRVRNRVPAKCRQGRPKDLDFIAKVSEVLLENGPLMVSDITKHVEKGKPAMLKFLAANMEYFAVVGYEPRRGVLGRVWGVRGVHNCKDAA
jgi:hypothetical protein